jgi:hypothetical protein
MAAGQPGLEGRCGRVEEGRWARDAGDHHHHIVLDGSIEQILAGGGGQDKCSGSAGCGYSVPQKAGAACVPVDPLWQTLVLQSAVAMQLQAGSSAECTSAYSCESAHPRLPHARAHSTLLPHVGSSYLQHQSVRWPWAACTTLQRAQ